MSDSDSSVPDGFRLIPGYPRYAIYWCLHRLSVHAPMECSAGISMETQANNHVSNLKWGTPRENQHDRIAHGTSTRGELNGRAKLKAGDVLEIRRRAATVERHMDIAKDFGVSISAIERIKARTSWKHI